MQLHEKKGYHPAYWLVSEHDPCLVTLPNTTMVVADCDNDMGSGNVALAQAEKKYNAKLAAAAPEMLQTLCDLRDYFHGRSDGEWAKMVMRNILSDFGESEPGQPTPVAVDEIKQLRAMLDRADDVINTIYESGQLRQELEELVRDYVTRPST